MVSAISFGSTYKVSTDWKTENIDAFNKFSEFCNKKCEENDNVRCSVKDSLLTKGLRDYQATKTLVVPDSMDSEVETYCANTGIKFTKLTNDQLLNEQSIIDRIEDTPENMLKTNVNIAELKKYLNSQESNIPHCENNYHKYFKKEVDFMLKSGDKIPASTLFIHGFDSDTKDILSYVNRFGKDKLNKNQISICLEQRTNKPDECIMIALSELGMKKIPVYVNAESYKIGKALGILGEN